MITREDYIDACQKIDPNGEYTDEHARAAGEDYLTLEDAREAFNRLVFEVIG